MELKLQLTSSLCYVWLQPGYDHSYFFISTFIDDHVAHHAKALHGSQ